MKIARQNLAAQVVGELKTVTYATPPMEERRRRRKKAYHVTVPLPSPSLMTVVESILFLVSWLVYQSATCLLFSKLLGDVVAQLVERRP